MKIVLDDAARNWFAACEKVNGTYRVWRDAEQMKAFLDMRIKDVMQDILEKAAGIRFCGSRAGESVKYESPAARLCKNIGVPNPLAVSLLSVKTANALGLPRDAVIGIAFCTEPDKPKAYIRFVYDECEVPKITAASSGEGIICTKAEFVNNTGNLTVRDFFPETPLAEFKWMYANITKNAKADAMALLKAEKLWEAEAILASAKQNVRLAEQMYDFVEYEYEESDADRMEREILLNAAG